MKIKRRFWGVLSVVLCGVLAQGCTTTGSTSKAPIMTIHAGGSKSEREQEFLLKQIKFGHQSKQGVVLGLRYFTDAGRPISGARPKDTLKIFSGLYKGTYTIDKILRIVSNQGSKRRRRVIVRIKGAFFDGSQASYWKTIHSGRLGVATSRFTFTDAVSDPKQFPPEVAIGSQLVLTADGQQRIFTIVGNTIDRKVGKLQRVAYRTAEPLPAGLRNLRYAIRQPDRKRSTGIKYRISWRGSSLGGYHFTIGINRRRYGQSEMTDLLKSNKASRAELISVNAKRNTAAVLRYTGIVAMVVGGFLGLVRRDDFEGTAQAIPWSIAGGGVLLLVGSIPFDVSANKDYLRAAEAYNRAIRKKLGLPPMEKFVLHHTPHKARVVQVPPSQPTPLRARK